MSEQLLSESGKRSLPLLGCIADDFTGATDLAGILVLNGMRTKVMLGIQEEEVKYSDAIVIALKSRSIPARYAVESSLAALRWLRDKGCRQFFFKYCSTFDSTSSGNIGPVAEALMDELGADFTIACPAFPANGRTIYNGYLFVGDVLLEESNMQFHPLTPMTDSSLVRLLRGQTNHKVGLIDYRKVSLGSRAISEAVDKARAGGMVMAVVDAIIESDLRNIAFACQDLPLLTGASGLASGIPETFRKRGLLTQNENASQLPYVSGLSAVISGSCSEATQQQVACWEVEGRPVFHLDPLSTNTDPYLAAKAAEWARTRMDDGPILISATANPESMKKVQATLGISNAGRIVEGLLADIACRLVELGVRRLIVAGGETSGAILKALDVHALRIGPQIDPGVHWAVSEDKRCLALALKSGNFGSEDLFLKAWSLLR